MAINYTDFNIIENDIETLNNYIKNITYIPSFSKKTWVVNDFPYIQEIDRIELGIKDLTNYYAIPPCYIYKQWLSYIGERPLKSFSKVNDYNRWINNINCINEYKDKFQLRFSGTSYCGEGVWL